MSIGRKLLKIPILLCLLFAIFVAFSLLYGFLDTAFIPYEYEQSELFISAGAADAGGATDAGDAGDATDAGDAADAGGATDTGDATDATDATDTGDVAGADNYDVAEVVDSPYDEIPAQEPPANPIDFKNITIQMDASDIHRGSLILINHDHRFDIPDDIDLVVIADERTSSYRAADAEMLLAAEAIGPLNDMMDAHLEATGSRRVGIRSAFRDFASQQRALNEHIASVGRTAALRLASLPGHSEHHSGLAVDFGVLTDGEFRVFTGTGIRSWFRENSYQFGFILRYPHEHRAVTRTNYEPWHFRYVGLPHSYFITSNGWSFEGYVEMLMSHTRENPFRARFDGKMYEIYHTQDMEIIIPYDKLFSISGNNIDGFFVTLATGPWLID